MNEPRREVIVPGTRPVRLSVIDVAQPHQNTGVMVCIHGAGGNAEQWHKQIAYFQQQYRVIAFDLRGHGESDAPYTSYSLEEFLWDMTQVLTTLGVQEPFVLLAHSFGGPIALTFAEAHPERVQRLVLIATAPEIHLNWGAELLLRLPLPLRLLERLRPMLLPKIHAPLFVIKQVLAGTLFPWRGWNLLPRIITPTLIIGGQFDILVPTSVLERMQQALPNARLEIIRYARHLPQLERADAVNRHIEHFITRRSNWRGEEEF